MENENKIDNNMINLTADDFAKGYSRQIKLPALRISKDATKPWDSQFFSRLIAITASWTQAMAGF